jgi:hypothetical protein
MFITVGVACGPGFPLQVLALPPLNPARAVGFPLQSLTLADALYFTRKNVFVYLLNRL